MPFIYINFVGLSGVGLGRREKKREKKNLAFSKNTHFSFHVSYSLRSTYIKNA